MDRMSNDFLDSGFLTMWGWQFPWRKMAENVAETLQKGMSVIITGKLKAQSYQTKEGDNRTVLEVLVEDVGPSLLFGTAQVARNPRDGQSAPQSGAWGNTPQQPAQGGWGRRHRPGRTTRRMCRNPSRTSNKPWTNSHHSDPIFSPRHVLTRVF
ncbi:hypothetical protein BA700_01490 [Corynebacterium stationis]|nr:hypothetical protein AW169_01490 [Corynebacterium stationis]AQX70177.1 hypothetical protein CA21670_00620 [Corynebacterium stationis]ASJ17880.1 hypothetical protein BA700_01490 [Corynebacterium stationis]